MARKYNYISNSDCCRGQGSTDRLEKCESCRWLPRRAPVCNLANIWTCSSPGPSLPLPLSTPLIHPPLLPALFDSPLGAASLRVLPGALGGSPVVVLSRSELS